MASERTIYPSQTQTRGLLFHGVASRYSVDIVKPPLMPAPFKWRTRNESHDRPGSHDKTRQREQCRRKSHSDVINWKEGKQGGGPPRFPRKQAILVRQLGNGEKELYLNKWRRASGARAVHFHLNRTRDGSV